MIITMETIEKFGPLEDDVFVEIFKDLGAEDLRVSDKETIDRYWADYISDMENRPSDAEDDLKIIDQIVNKYF
jgi:hypothetical protein